MSPATIPAFGVFEGGGVKGAALAGAVTAAHQFGVRFHAVAGTSAGAVIAALYATGYREEHDVRNAMVNMPLASFCDGFKGEPPESVVERTLQFIIDRNADLRALVSSLRGGMLGIGRGLLDQRNRQLLRDLGTALDGLVPLVERVISQWGIYDGDELVTWLDERLRDGINSMMATPPSQRLSPADRVRFRDLPDGFDLRIVATRLDPQRSLVVYRRDLYPEMPIATAVRQSVAIPFFFKPVQHDGAWHIDGGAASNFPAWLFGQPLSEERDPLPIIGFRLVEPMSVAGVAAQRNLQSFSSFLRATLHAMLWSGGELQYRHLSRLHLIELDTQGVSTTNFRLSRADQKSLFDQGMQKTELELRRLSDQRQLQRDRRPELESQLRALCQGIARAIGRDEHALVETDGTKVVRAAIMIPTLDPGFRRVVSSWNFDGDADHDLELPTYSGLTGVAWARPGNVVWADLGQFRDTYADGVSLYAMPPQVQSKVRRQAELMVAVAITAQNSHDPIATLSIDTDLRILDLPQEQAQQVQNDVEEAFILAASMLTPTIQALYSA